MRLLSPVIILVLLFVLNSVSTAQIQCHLDSTGRIPINDLGTGTWLGQVGGLYPGGTNIRPANHTTAGLNFTNAIFPVDANGVRDDINGTILMIGVGMSNTRIEFEMFETFVDTAQNIHPRLKVMSVAQDSHDINRVLNPDHIYWSNISTMLNDSGFTDEQVQAIWYKQAVAWPLDPNYVTDTTYTGYLDSLVAGLKTHMHTIHNKFPNCRVLYISSRIYGDYMEADFQLNPEPFAYYNGWGVKALVEAQINGDPDLIYEGVDANSPWISWGPYMWADGHNPRSDGLTWDCPIDFKEDGAHPSDFGAMKVAGYLLDFFKTDETTISWFTENPLTAVEEDADPVLISDFSISNYPNPFNGTTVFTYTLPEAGNVTLKIYNNLGQQVQVILSEYQAAGTHNLQWTANIPSGIYFYQLTSGEHRVVRKMALMN